ncbi:MAG: hypothetical protein J6A94_03740 [Lachnospiraceae bacterium]|nr:hypothetical protein [Lachnospiraceae bacterium]
MKTIETVLSEEKKQIEIILSEAYARLKSAPKGHLRIAKKRTGVEYYYKGGDVKLKNGRYLKKSEEELARRIAQRDYDMRVVKQAEERRKAITIFLKKYKETSLKHVFEHTNQFRRNLVCAPEISDEEYIKKWQAIEYQGKTFDDDMQEILTEKGERVRSKSEKIIADKLYLLGIPYRYEYPLKLAGNRTIYPDFTILKMPEREEVYLEHFGMMDDSDYVDSAMFKLNTYEKNGIYLGVKLFITHETKQYPLSTKALDGLVKKVFCAE